MNTRNEKFEQHPDSAIFLDDIFKPEFYVIPRSMFSEAKGKILAQKIIALDPSSKQVSRTICSKYVALSSLNAIDSFLHKNYGIGLIEKARQGMRSDKCISISYHYSRSFLSLDQKTCMSLNLFGDKNSIIKLFNPITEMGHLQLRRRINQPSADSSKIEKWYNILKVMLDLDS